ncbi:MAG: hypothetical protein WDO73_23680 [Ignavibacteriota bacterium]
MDAIRKILANLEATQTEGTEEYAGLAERLKAAAEHAEDVPAIPIPAVESAPAETERSSSVSDSAIRVDVGLLDKLMNLVGELVLAPQSGAAVHHTERGRRTERHRAAPQPDYNRAAGKTS